MQVLDQNGGELYLISKEKEPCVVCGKRTRQIEIHFDSRVCSFKCCKVLIDKYIIQKTY